MNLKSYMIPVNSSHNLSMTFEYTKERNTLTEVCTYKDRCANQSR